MGFLLLGASLDTFEALRATYIYLVLYAAMTSGFMLSFLHLNRADGRPLAFLSDFCGLARTENTVC
jgi:NADH:ubiquinone oxidoreductase subunit 2 (subunit N)